MAKRQRPASPEELTVGTEVIYNSNKTGVVSDAFGPLDQFWVKDSVTQEKVRHPDGEVWAFNSSQLELVVQPQKTARGAEAGQAEVVLSSSARVLVIGTEYQMLQIIEHFGPPDGSVRREPQMLLAIPCNSCQCDTVSSSLLEQAASGIDDSMFELARNLRPDLGSKLGIRPHQLKQALEQLGPDLTQLDDYYCLSAVTLPHGWQAIESNYGARRRTMQETRIDLGTTAEGEAIEGESSLERTAMRVLGEACGIRINEPVWEEEVQYRMRKLLSVDLPLRYYDGLQTKGFVLILPGDLVPTNEGGLLTFREPGPLAYGSSLLFGAAVGAAAKLGTGDGHQIGGKTVGDWKAEQGQFSNLPRLPDGWIRIKSRSSEEVYYWNTRTQTSTYEHPLPEGWIKQRSKSTGKVYYFNAKKRQSMYTIPTEP